MQRRQFLAALSGVIGSSVVVGCRGRQTAHVLKDKDEDMVGSHTAGAETWEPLIAETVSKLLGRQSFVLQTASAEGFPAGKKKICFLGVENKSAEELGDFKEQIYQKIDTCITESDVFVPITRRYVEAGLKQCGMRPEDLMVPNNQRNFQAVMEKLEQPFDFLLYATVTSGTTRSNSKDYQRDYLLTLELVNIHTGTAEKESEELRKGYHKSRLGKLKHYGV
ncbi:MAG TPA: penicillin-binding protein activator LpoB [Planctomycetaceae bacterium]|jgi:hypothetical protein|nr:penicillin-binding protein activator LpoB [Planctomycetaceae bacterium]